MAQAAHPILEAIPTLQIGYFWEPCEFWNCINGQAIPSWYRWEWNRVTNKDGSWYVHVCGKPQHFSADFTINTDGIEQ
ncbi:uncharacterized protein L201_006689 [Kwoniella dendrophila CBS 6074]|uniref:Uncharacterized protein n=1 Tax=Kwoniella dendrophila CBS 6074 TaxID=1295534 RepID=A0AAX4K2F2_9TREE